MSRRSVALAVLLALSLALGALPAAAALPRAQPPAADVRPASGETPEGVAPSIARPPWLRAVASAGHAPAAAERDPAAAPEGVAPSMARPPWLPAVASAGHAPAAAPQGIEVYILVLADPPLAGYGGGLPGLAATSPRARGEARLDLRSAAAAAYLRHLDARQGDLLGRLGAAVGRQLAPIARYRHALNGLALALGPTEAATAAALPGVRLVQRSAPRALASDSGPALIGAAQRDLRPALFTADLVPVAAAPPGVGAGSGTATLTYDSATRRLGVRVEYEGLGAMATSARLEAGEPGAAAAATLDLTPLAAPERGLFAGELSLGAAGGQDAERIEAALLGGELAVVVDTGAAPAGALGGRLRPARGAAVIIGLIDGGIAADHPAFADIGADGHNHANPLGEGAYLGVCDQGGQVPPFPCNDKLIGAYTFPATAGSPDPAGRPSPFDESGHGSHTAATAAGNVTSGAGVAGVPLGPVAGVAPHAALIAYDVCGTATSGGCPLAAIVAAIDQAVADGVRVANLSISGAPGDPWQEADALALLGALEAGMLAVTAAGNAGPAPGSVGSPANAPWAVAVGASTHARRYTRTLDELTGGAAPPPGPLVGVGLGAERLPPAPVVDAATLEDLLGDPNPHCLPFSRLQRLDGQIVVCRHLLGPAAAARNAAAAGAAGLVIVWPAEHGAQQPVEPLPIPAVQLDAVAGEQLLAWLAAGADHTAAIGPSAVDESAAADQVAWFSARGPSRRAPDTLKPDLVAPGVNILAASTERDPTAPDYAFLSGTSMAAPHVAGAAALLVELRPGWTPGEIRSALMTTAQPTLVEPSGGQPATPHAIGAGRVSADRAARAGLLLDETAERFRAADPSRGGDPSQLNLPSLSSGACLGSCVFTRTLRSALPTAATWSATGAGSPGLRLEVRPARFTIAPGALQTIVITAGVTLEGFAPPGTFAFGAVTLTEQRGLAPQARLPVALETPSAVLPPRVELRALTAEGAALSPPLRTVAAPELTLRVLGPGPGEVRTLMVGADPTPADPLDSPPGAAVTTIAVPAGSPRVSVAILGTAAPDLDLFLFADGEGGPADGAAQLAELVCVSAGASSAERCDLQLDGRGERHLIALVQRYVGSAADFDYVDLLVSVVPTADLGRVRARGPDSVRPGEPFQAELAWSLTAGAVAPGRHIGALQLSSTADPADAGDLGVIPLDMVYLPGRTFLPLVGS